MSRIFSEVLNQLLSEQHARFTAAELGEVAGISTNMIYKVKNDDADLNHVRAQRLATYCAENGDLRLARCFVTPAYEIVPRAKAHADGSVHDEVADLVVSTGRATERHRAGDRDGLSEEIGRLEAVIARLKAERDRL